VLLFFYIKNLERPTFTGIFPFILNKIFLIINIAKKISFGKD